MSIVLVRHGQTAGNFSRILQVPETPLNDTGLQQASLVAKRLALMKPSQIVCSDLLRARMTAEPLAQLTGLEVQLEPLLQERNFGDYRGRHYSEFAEGHPFGPDVEPPNGETWAMFHARVAEAFAAVRARRAAMNGLLIVITHGLVLRSAFEFVVPCGTLVVPTAFDNTSISVLAGEAPHAAELINCISHLGGGANEVGAA